MYMTSGIGMYMTRKLNAADSRNPLIGLRSHSADLPEQKHKSLKEVSEVIVSGYLGVGRKLDVTENLGRMQKYATLP